MTKKLPLRKRTEKMDAFVQKLATSHRFSFEYASKALNKAMPIKCESGQLYVDKMKQALKGPIIQ